MVKLTEEMVIARTRMSDFSAVKKLNCWGTELTDVSILRKMKNVEVLSLSVNNIDTLADFEYCESLQDLFVRKNNIKDLNEVCYLQALPNLRNLWLGENPCAEKEGYRLAVLRALPNLEKLDDKVVTAEEVQTALARGKILVHPLDMVPGSEPESPEEVANKFITVPEEEENRRYSSSSDQKSIDEAHDLQEEYHDTDRRNANYNVSPPQHYPQNSQYGYELQNGQSKSQSKDDIVHQDTRNNGETVATNTLEIGKDYDDQPVISRNNTDYDERRAYSEYGSGEVPQRIYAPVSPRTQYSMSESADDRRIDKNSYDYEERRQLDYEEAQQPQLPTQSRRMSGQYNRDREDPNQVPGWVRHSSKEKCRTQFHYHRRPVTRNSNILSAVLCLVKELDYPSLEVVEMAVRNRMDELEE